jgi:hypothetical protein
MADALARELASRIAVAGMGYFKKEISRRSRFLGEIPGSAASFEDLKPPWKSGPFRAA